MSDTSPVRVHYFDRQFLTTQDFVAEQAYHLAMRRRDTIGLHSWGIVRGLEVVVEDKTRLVVCPGLAIDGYGRELLLPQGHTINAQVFNQYASDVVEVWLTYAQTPAESARPGYVVPCQDGETGLYRMQEFGRVDVRPPNRYLALDPSDDLSERRQPPGVPDADLVFNPARLPPDDPAQAWPVYLGRVRRAPTQTPPYLIDLVGRPYAGVVAEAVTHPAERGGVALYGADSAARLQLGAEPVGEDDRFVVSLYSAPAQRRVARLSMDKQGDLRILGDTTCYGDVVVAGGSVEFGAGPAYAEPKPWRIYRVVGATPLAQVKPDAAKTGEGQSGGQATTQATQQGGPDGGSQPPDPGATELRIEMAAAPASQTPGLNRVVIGKWSDQDKRFVPCLTVADDCSVTVHGNLVVTGFLNSPPSATTTAPPSEMAEAAFQAASMQGLFNQLSRAGEVSRLAEAASAMELALAPWETQFRRLKASLVGAPRSVVAQVREEMNRLLPALEDEPGQGSGTPPTPPNPTPAPGDPGGSG